MDAAGCQGRWNDVRLAVQTLADLIQTCQDAFGEDETTPKVCAAVAGSDPCSRAQQYLIVPATVLQVSAITKKRLTIRAMQGLQGGSQLAQVRMVSLVTHAD
jgi:hypothetical protein